MDKTVRFEAWVSSVRDRAGEGGNGGSGGDDEGDDGSAILSANIKSV